MSIQYFYNFCLKDIDQTDLEGDLLSGIRKSYYAGNHKIKDKITGNSDSQPLFYEFLLEKEKPMKWVVKNASGMVVQEVMMSDNGKYYIYFYSKQALYKRLLFSKHHTLLKAEYFDTESGAVKHTLEPRKAQTGLCILYIVKNSAHPIPLFEEPRIDDSELRERMKDGFDNYTVIASTNDGILRFLSDEQLEDFNSVKEKYETEIAQQREKSYTDGETPLLDKIKVNDFNVKRNLSTALDITMAMEFGYNDEYEESPNEPAAVQNPAEPEPYYDDTILIDGYDAIREPAVESTEEQTASEELTADATEPDAENLSDDVAEPAADAADSDSEITSDETDVPDEPVLMPFSRNEQDQPEECSGSQPDKRIMADGAVYSYYGELDDHGNRSGYGRTMTELGRTAYEGHYDNDKRSGNGSYYYKNGTLCYTGDWMENVRHGIGVGISSRDGSIHVGSWKNNKPDGNGVRLTAEGDIKFVCKELLDGTTVLMHYMPDDTVIISKYDKYGMKIGDTTISLKDLPI